MLPFAAFGLFLALAYALIMGAYFYYWQKMPTWKIPAGFRPATSVTVVVPARDEAANIEACLRSILRGNFPPDLLEIIVVDDHSTDGTPEIVLQMAENQVVQIKLLRLADFLRPGEQLKAHKKKAIEIALAVARGTLIVTTDADCICPPDWLPLLVSRFEAAPERVKMLAAPVAFFREKNLLQRFQSLDFAGMMGITGAGIFGRFQRMGNGANLAYTRSVFREIGGYAGADERASGDDMFLLQKVARRFPDGIFFLKNSAATVLTEAKPDWRSFLAQRIRWGSKNAAYPEKGVTFILALVFFFCWSIVLCSLAALFFPGKFWFAMLAFQLIVKALADWFFLRAMCRFFKREDLLRSFWPAFGLHIGYIAFVGLASQFFRQYEWKGRVLR